MKLFNLFLFWCSVLSTHVLANNDAAPYELLHYYYVYKMEWDAGVEKTIAPGCATEYKKMCFFDQFAKFLIEDRWNKVYLPTKADRTKTPGVGAAKRLSIKMPTSARYNLEKLLPSIKANARDFPRVFETVLHSANKAIKTGKVKNDDVKQAVAMAQQVKEARENAVFKTQERMLQSLIGKEAYDYVAYKGQHDFDWQATFEAIDDAVKNDRLSKEEGGTLKKTMDNFSKTYQDDIATGHISDINHLNIMRALETSITDLTEVIEESSSDSDFAIPGPEPADTCNVEFG